MRKSGIVYTLLQYFIFSIAPTVASFPLMGQMSFALQQNISPGNKDLDPATDLRLLSSVPEGTYHSSHPAYYINSLSARTIYSDQLNYNDPDLKKGWLLKRNNIETNEENLIRIKTTSFVYPKNSKTEKGITHYSSDKLILYARLLKYYAKKNGFDTAYAFLSNMGMRSNKKRFFVINLVTLEIEESGLVAHGKGQGKSVYDKQYSNESGSNATSLGRYKITGKYSGEYGEAYRMAGLDSSNKNAGTRNIVLHPMNCIPDTENNMPACVSEGCPAVSAKFFSLLREIIDSRKNPILLWIFDSNLEELVDESHLKYRIFKTPEPNNEIWNFVFQASPETPFPIEDNRDKLKVKFRSDLAGDISIMENIPGSKKELNSIHTESNKLNSHSLNTQVSLPKIRQNTTPELLNVYPVANRTIYIPVDLSYGFIKGKKTQYITH